MEIYLIRHTTPKVEKGVCYGQTDLELIDNYDKEFKAIHQLIPRGNYKVYSSPLKRCSILAKTFSDTVIYDTRLKELNFGDWEMQPWDNIAKNSIAPWMKDFVNVIIPNGESYIQLSKRVNDFFITLIKKNSNQNIIITTHSGVIRAYLANVLGISLKESFSFSITYGNVFKLKKEGGSIKLLSEI